MLDLLSGSRGSIPPYCLHTSERFWEGKLDGGGTGACVEKVYCDHPSFIMA